MFRRTAFLTAALVATAVAPAAAQVSADPAFHAAAVQDRAAAEQRSLDQLANPAYARAVAPDVAAYADGSDTDSVLVDPFRKSWAPARGDTAEIAYKNRYGATIRGRLWGPKDQRGAAPAVVLVPGLGGSEESYRGLAQGLAEGGYVVLAFDPQTQGDSDVKPPAPFCTPGAWQQPQELGLREQGRCAGIPGREPPGPFETALTGSGLGDVGYAADGVPFIAEAASDQAPPRGLPAAYDTFRATFVLGAFDAVDWLRSPANPWRDRIMADRIGVAGHSAGADGAVQAANGDPSRFRVAVAWDTFGALLPAVSPKVPTMLQVSEQQAFLGPFRQRPPAERWSAIAIGRAFRQTGVPSMTLALRGSTHQEWPYIPLQGVNPLGGAPLAGASRLGERVSLHYTLAWLDRWLKPGGAGDRAAARGRLLGGAFDGSADASSIGTGTAGTDGTNRPYLIKGLPTAAQLSRFLPSSYAFDGQSCADMLAGC